MVLGRKKQGCSLRKYFRTGGYKANLNQDLFFSLTTGMLIDTTGSAEVPFMYFGSIQIFGGAVSLLVWWLMIRQNKH